MKKCDHHPDFPYCWDEKKYLRCKNCGMRLLIEFKTGEVSEAPEPTETKQQTEE